MSSQAQIDANRLNAQKSTGPTSPEGKTASSMNALKSGIDAHSHIIRGEDPAELEALTATFLLQFQPADPNQLALVDTLIAAEWTQRRLRRIEAQLWAHQIERLDEYVPRAEGVDDSSQRNLLPGRAYQNALEAFTRLGRRMDATNRTYLRTLKALVDRASGPPAEPASVEHHCSQPGPQPATHAWKPYRPPAVPPASPAPEPAPTKETQPLTPQIGFVPPLTLTTGERSSPLVTPAISSPYL